MKNKLSYVDVCILKIIAILMVVISHYYRFFEQTSSASGLKSVGFFGASLFAFISGYLAEVNKDKLKKIGYRWLIKKIYGVVIPYLIVNVLSIYLYNSGKNIFAQIFFGSNDGVLWYVPFIVLFYIIYYFVVSNDLPLRSLFYLGVVIYILLQKCGIDSQWYTSIGALLLGIYLAKIKESKLRYALLFGVLLVISTVLSVKMQNNMIIKCLFITIAGIGFCGGMYINIMNMPTIDGDGTGFNYRISIISASMYWIYLVHMKVGYVLDMIGNISVVNYVVYTIGVSFIANVLYMTIINRIGKIKK